MSQKACSFNVNRLTYLQIRPKPRRKRDITNLLPFGFFVASLIKMPAAQPSIFGSVALNDALLKYNQIREKQDKSQKSLQC